MADPVSADLGSFFAASRAAIVELDASGSVRAWNPAAERLFGWRSDEVLGCALPIVRSEDALRFQLFRQSVLAGEAHAIFETALSKTGDSIPVRVWQMPSVDVAGRIAGVWMLLARANEREQALEQMRAIFDTSLDAAITSDANGRVRFWSQRATQMFGWTQAEAITPLVEDSALVGVVGTACDTTDGVAPAQPEPRRGDETLLLIDDDESVRRMTLRILRTVGYTVLEAADGQQGLQVARAYPGPIHLVISDVVMPLVSGNAVVEELRLERPDACYLLTSGYAEDSLDPSDPAERMPFIAKPFSGRELKRKVRDVLDQRGI